jgi:CRISPR-associated protein Csm4
MKQTYKIYKLSFRSPVHLSRGKGDYYDQSQEILHSDTLKSSLFVSALQLFGEKVAETILNGCRVSSAFPFYGNELFFPKPMCRIQKIRGTDELKQAKKLKKIQYLGQSYFEDLLNGSESEIQPEHLHSGGAYCSAHSDLTATKAEQDFMFVSEVQQRVTIPLERDEDPTPYYVERMRFAQNAGLYFILENDTADIDAIDASLKLLGDTGVGTDKSVGNGQFIFTKGELTLTLPENASNQLNLSLYCPTRSEISDGRILEQGQYQIVQRGGFIASPQDSGNATLRKRSVYMFTEGSVFHGTSGLKGKVLNLKPEIETVRHPIWRDGSSIFIPIKI